MNFREHRELPHNLNGNESSNQLIVFMHGYPDTLNLWSGIIPSFEKDYLVLNVTYPNFTNMERSKWGASLEEIVERLKITIDKVNSTKKRKVSFVTHDWGAYFGFRFGLKYPEYVDDMLSIDVSYSSEVTFAKFSYQIILAAAFFIGGRIGDSRTKGIIKT